jgi:glycerate kinase
MTSPRVLIAPDSFKGTMSATDVADALAAGVHEAGGTADLCPVADGGEGTLDALRPSVPGRLVSHDVTAPDGRLVRASYLLGDDGTTAVIETAAASGLHLIDPETVDAFAATSAGTGELIAAAARAGAHEILVGVGGSGFSDGGLGALAAIENAGGLGDARLVVLCDVVTSYENAARIFGPQKGADPETVSRLSDRLIRTAESLPRNPSGVPRTGAAGGLAGALWAEHAAELVCGIDAVLERTGFRTRLRGMDGVFTGEGRLDDQTVDGKAIDGVTRWARQRNVPVYAVVGQNRASEAALQQLGIAAVEEAGNPDALRQAAARLTDHMTTISSTDSRRSGAASRGNEEVKTP